MEVEERFVLKALMDNSYSVSWPGYEWVVCDNENKARNLLKILFEEVKVDEAVLAVQKTQIPREEEFIEYIPLRTYAQDPHGAGKFLVHRYAVTGIKFPGREQAEQFKTIMEKRLAWCRLGGQSWS